MDDDHEGPPAALSPQRAPGHRVATVAPAIDGTRDPWAPTTSNSLAGFERDEAQQVRHRMQRILVLGMVMTPIVLLTDWFVCRFAEPSPAAPLYALHLLMMVGFAGLALRIRRYRSSRELLIAGQIATPLTTLIGSTLPSLFAGGLGSLYCLIATMIMVGRSLSRNDHWRVALPSIVATVLLHPVAMVIAALASPRIALQFADPAQVAHFVAFTIGNAFVGVVVLVGGHANHNLRRQLHDARDVGRYQLRRLLGKGGMGEVWAAYYPALRREVALKILRLGEREPAAQVTRFEREVAATAELTHPNTVRIFDFGVTDDGLWYYAMELLEGETLRELVRREGPLEPRRAARLVADAADAIAEAHARGIVHRDLKPENLFVTRPGAERDFVKVIDFGLARRPDLNLTQVTTTDILGTPAYFSPEVALGQPADARADVYALGASLYFALAGKPPFEAHELAALLHAIASETPSPPSLVRRAPLPDELERLVLLAMARDLSARPSAAELAGQLRGFADRVG